MLDAVLGTVLRPEAARSGLDVIGETCSSISEIQNAAGQRENKNQLKQAA